MQARLGRVHIPAGSYTFTTQIVFTTPCVLAGDGAVNTTLQYTQTTGTALTLEGTFSGVKNPMTFWGPAEALRLLV